MGNTHIKIASPIGELTLVASELGLAAILWEEDDPKRTRINIGPKNEKNPVLLETKQQLEEYFTGARKVFSLTLDFTGTEFQQSVWRALLTIPYGQTRSYAQIAEQIGNVKAMRAVGAANGKNPISIIAPCHRVIGADGSLTGFAGGLHIKAKLLDIEKAQLPLPPA